MTNATVARHRADTALRVYADVVQPTLLQSLSGRRCGRLVIEVCTTYLHITIGHVRSAIGYTRILLCFVFVVDGKSLTRTANGSLLASNVNMEFNENDT